MNNKEKHDKFANEIKVNTNSVNKLIKKNAFLKKIDGNEKLLGMLSVDRLQKLEKYYDNIIKQNNKKLKN